MVGPYCRVCGHGEVEQDLDEEICAICRVMRNFCMAKIEGRMARWTFEQNKTSTGT